MASFPAFFSNLYTTTIVFFSLILLEAVLSIRSITRTLRGFQKNPIASLNYLAMVEERHPAKRYLTGSRPELIECAVCLSKIEEGEEIRELQCGHSFHRDCVDKWLERDCATCPLCRRYVLPEEILSEHRRLEGEQESFGDEELIFYLSALHGSSLHRLFYFS